MNMINEVISRQWGITPVAEPKAKSTPLNDKQIEKLVYVKLNDIYASIQDGLGVDCGGFAGDMHCGEGQNLEDALTAYFQKYAEAEADYQVECEENRIEVYQG